MTEDIRWWMPASIMKSETAKTSKRIVQGIASTEEVDAQGERVLQEGIDFRPLLESGFINQDHQPGFSAIIGQPLEARITSVEGRPAMFFKGVLFEGVPAADSAWSLLNALEKARAEGTANRRLGWSVEGAVVERRGNLIAKSVVRHMALTHQPVAMGTFADLAKSLVMAKSGAVSSAASTSPLLFQSATLHTDAALRLQNLAGGRKSMREVCLALFGENSDKCKAAHGIYKGRGAIVAHLMTCVGLSKDEAVAITTDLSKQLR